MIAGKSLAHYPFLLARCYRLRQGVQDFFLKGLTFLNFILHTLLLKTLNRFIDEHEGCFQIFAYLKMDGSQPKLPSSKLFHSSKLFRRLNTIHEELFCVLISFFF